MFSTVLKILDNIIDDVQEFCFIMSHLFQHDILNYFMSKTNSQSKNLVNLKSLETSSSFQKKVLSLGDVAIVINNDFPNGNKIYHRTTSYSFEKKVCKKLPNLLNASPLSSSLNGTQVTEVASTRPTLRPRTSTPQRQEVTVQTNLPNRVKDLDAHFRILQLEQELANLRSQMATILAVYKVSNTGNELKFHCLEHDRTLIASLPPLILPVPSAPPPPPPPPPQELLTTDIGIKSLKQQIAKNKTLKETQGNGIRSTTTSSVVDMTEILKGLKNVKLRRIERSPGGTPLKKPRCPRGDDPTSLLTIALKKRFASIHPQESPQSDILNTSWDNISGEDIPTSSDTLVSGSPHLKPVTADIIVQKPLSPVMEVT